METTAQDNSKAILIEDKTLPAVKCDECGATDKPQLTSPTSHYPPSAQTALVCERAKSLNTRWRI